MTSLAAMVSGGSGFTPEYSFVRGEFAFGDERLPYFSVAMKLRDCARYLTMARDLVFDVNVPVQFDELFQRELSRPRAEGPLLDYLKQPDRLKFFNAFTVVLLPVQSSGKPIPLHQFPDPENSPLAAEEPSMQPTRVGGVQVRQLEGSELGFIRWNPDSVRAVVVDGQHRFFALRELLDDEAYSGMLQQDLTKIPILLLVLDDAVGFKAPLGEASVLSASRVIFTDLNKNAVALTRAREYLLDDSDLTSVSMRAIVTNSIGGSTGLAALSLAQIPLALLDWYSEQARFDSGLHLTTVLTLHELVRATIDRPSVSPTDYDALHLWVEGLHSRLGMDDLSPAWNLGAVRKRISMYEERQLPFALSPAEVKLLGDAYRRNLGQLVTVPLTGLTPYAELRSRYTELGLLGGPTELWLGHDLDGKKAYEKQTETTPLGTAVAVATEVKSSFGLPYQVVFQKALINSVRDLDGCSSELLEAWDIDGGPKPEGVERAAFLSCWLERMNLRLTAAYSNNFWRGAAISSGDRIDFTQRGVAGLTGLLFLVAYAPLESWAGVPSRPSRGESALLKLYRGDGNGDLASIATGDPLAPDAPSALAALRWWDVIASQIRPGRAGGSLAAAVRNAARPYRASLRTYVTDMAKARNLVVEDLDRDRLVTVLAARRFAFLASSLQEKC